MTIPTVSVILPVFNGESYLAEALESVLSQSYSQYEILIVDDGSGDGSAAILERFREQHPEKIRVLRHAGRKNRGVAFSRNLAVGLARGKYLAFIDQDDLWLPEKLERQVAFMEGNPDVGLCYTRARILRQGGGQQFIPGVDVLGDEPPADIGTTLLKVVSIEMNYIFSAVLARAEDVRAAGGFPEDMLFQSDDRVLVAKIAARHRLGLVPEALCSFRAHDDHYTQNVLQTGIAPIVFFDLQLHVVRWLLATGGWEWAHAISHHVLPRFYAQAAFCLGQMELKFLLQNGFPVSAARRRGGLSRICRRALKTRLLWRWRDPLREQLLLQHNYPLPPIGIPDQPVVSVVVPAYNAAKYLAAAIESVLGQTRQDFEILVVDDGSKDETLEIARRYAEAQPERVRVCRHPGGANRGVAATRNLAIAQARGRFVAFLDADDTWLPRKLELQVELMEERPWLGVTYTDATIIREGDGHKFLPGVETLGNEPAPDALDNLIGIVTIQINYIFSTVMVRTELIRAVGGFLEHLPFQSEDRIMVAMVSSTHLVGRVPQVLAEYRAHGESYSASVVKAKTANVIVFDMQVKVIRWLLAAGQRGVGINLAARLIPGSFLRSLPRLGLKTVGPWLRDILSLAWRLPHLPLIVLLFHLTERARRRRECR